MTKSQFVILLLLVLASFVGYASCRQNAQIDAENAADADFMKRKEDVTRRQVEFNDRRRKSGLPQVKFGDDEQRSGTIPDSEIIPSPSL